MTDRLASGTTSGVCLPSRSTPGAQVPPFDPFTPASDGRTPLAPGCVVTLVLGAGAPSAFGRRVVRGTVLGCAERRMDCLDVHLTRIATWIAHVTPVDFEVLPPTFNAVFRVGIVRTVTETVRLLTGDDPTGRSILTVAEVPFARCWTCQRPVDAGAVHCPQCGRRVSVGRGAARPSLPPVDADAGCPHCWHLVSSRTPFCPICGHDRMDSPAVAAIVGRQIQCVLVAGHVRLGRLAGVVTDASTRRLFARGGLQLVATVRELTAADQQTAARLHGPLPIGFSTMFVLRGGAGDPAATLAAIEEGAMLRATELKRRCVVCAERGAATAPYVLGRYCAACGTRGRVLPHPDAAVRAQGRSASHRIPTHRCGTPYRSWEDRYCVGCGESLEGYEPSQGRFALLG